MSAIIQSRHIEHGREAIGQHARHLIHTTRHRACRILAMTNVLQERSYLVTFRTALRRHFVSDAPHHHAGMVAILAKHVYHILLGPLLKEAVIAVFAFGNVPLVERFHHHHKAHLIAKFNQLRRRHVVRRTDGITSHIFQQCQLTAKSRYIDCGSQRAKVVMIAYPLELTMLAVQEETFVGHQLNAADTETGSILVGLLPIYINL